MNGSELTDRLDALDAKLDALISSTGMTLDAKRYLTSRDVGLLVGLSTRTIQNRSSYDRDDPLYIPSVRFGGKRKYYDRRVVERLFRMSS